MRLMSCLVALLVSLAFGEALAANEFNAYSKPSFEASQQQNKPLIVHIHADWCPTCVRQVPALSQALADPSLAGVEAFRVNFDTDREFLMTHRVPNQSVILVFKNGKEVLRLNGVTNAQQIKSKIISALQ